MVVSVQKCLYSGKSSCFLAKVVLICQGGSIRAKVVVYGQTFLFSGKVVVFE